ncbi:Tn3 family transposase (plasmid) [Cupriavidus sp. KK10]|jgi:TnpA family transposase|uniref:Tn3 family transposase n=1 Tax=Cupriavidus sp. KK10 TaxID=1478019 RepID=UPI001BAAC5EC|nr:Tn3 family transposase [Cupriavidus sp. KK10]QUN32294.1 Tn3 family transposase [Cupriavidus sp. KK10]
MPPIHETAYPVLPAEPTVVELRAAFTPTAAEIRFARSQARQASTSVLILVQLKLLQRLGYFPMLTEVPAAVIEHVRAALRARPLSRSVLTRYDVSGTRARHQKLLRAYVGIRQVDANAQAWLESQATDAARTKAELPDIVKLLIEELIRGRYELPPLAGLQRMAAQARARLNEAIYRTITGALDDALKTRIEALFDGQTGKSGWDQLKREPKRPATREIASFLKHIHGLRKLADGLPPAPPMLSVAKRTQLVTEARALDITKLRGLKPPKRYTLAVLFIQAQLQKALDDVAEIFIKVMRKLESLARTRLQQYQLAHADALESLVGQFRDVLQVLQDDGIADIFRLQKVREVLGNDAAGAFARCNEHIAYAGNFDPPFMLAPYRQQRSLLFQCVEVLPLRSSSQDKAILVALAWMDGFRASHREYLQLTDNDLANLPLDWIPDKWNKAIFPDGRSARLLHRRYFELCVFHQVMQELSSGDLYVEGSDRFDDFRVHQVSQQEFQREMPRYCEIVGLPTDGKSFIKTLRDKLSAVLDEVDANFPANDSIEFGEQGLIIHKPGKEPDPPNKMLIDQAITASMPQISILDVLTETEQWLNLHQLFGPLSGFDAKLDEPRKRFISTLFCYGCNLGPSQTARSVKGLSRKQIAWLNLHHVTEERLDKAIVKVINAYNQFALPKYWGSGKRVSADGTKWSLYEQNLLSEYHIRYGGYGGIGYYHVSDMYIALFSNFIPCGVHEAVYILDGLIRNGSEIQPDTIHGDTQAQSGPVFGLSYLLGINLMPRMRNIKGLVLFKADRRRKYAHIESLCRQTINWDLIQRHYPDMLRVAVSIKAGRMTPSTILRRLGSDSAKNKLYFAFRELGRVIRTLFLLKYLNEPELRRTIHAATNKSEQFNDFAQWLMFGGDGTIAENVRHEQRKVIKYNQLVANMVILYNVQWMSRKLKALQEKGHPVDAEVLKVLSPYRREHINRLGDYLLDLRRRAPPLDPTIEFLFKSAA